MWSSKKYKKAADKHYKTCKHLLNSIDTVKPDVKPQVISNVFYLSGYILECIFKFSLLEANHKKGKYTLLEIEQMHLKTHEIFPSKTNKKKGVPDLWSQIISRGILKQKGITWTELSKEWNSEIRYETDIPKYSDIALVEKHFNQTVIPIYNALKDIN